jgi:histidine triad (HIT) family protein
MGSCLFCDILEEKAEASIVYRDEHCCAFLDLYPANPGHVLVIPVKHAAQTSELDEEIGGHIFQVGLKLAEAIRRSKLKCDGINFHLADGSAAGQEIFHVHLHIIPRIQGDGFGFKFARGRIPRAERSDLESVAVTIRKAL